MSQNPIQIVKAIFGTAIMVLVVIVVFDGVMSSSSAPEPGDAYYSEFMGIVETVPLIFVLLGLASIIAVGAFAVGQLD